MNRALLPAFTMVFAWSALLCASELRVAGIFSDQMVLQRDLPVRIWGWADAGQLVTVVFAGQSQDTTADAAGRWSLTLNPLAASAEPRLLAIHGSGGSELKVRGVLVGDVFQCSGQSNMAASMDSCKRRPGTLEDIKGTNLPMVRFFQTPNATFCAQPQEDVRARWEPVGPQTNAHLAAVPFYFARAMHEHLKVPIGIVRASHAGGAAEIKMPLEALLSIESGNRFHADALKRYSPEGRAARDQIFQDRWRAAAEQARVEGKPEPAKPSPSPVVDGGYPSSDWNGVIAPVIRYTKRAVLWYQGEHNAGRAYDYRDLLPVLIRSWRQAGGQSDLPFVIVQLPAYGHAEAEQHWPVLRESQWFAQRATPHTGLVVTIDRGEKDNIHPADKREVGQRLALETRRLVFGDKVTGCGPLYDSHTLDGARMIVRFTNTGGGLRCADAKALDGFAVSGADRRFVVARARIAGDTVIVQSPDVPKPVAARYAWSGCPPVSLFSSEGLPAGPFRTDDSKP